MKERKKRFSDEELLDDLRYLYKKLGRAPQARDMTKYGKRNYLTYWARFGSLIIALEKAGIEPASRQWFSDEELLEDLKRLNKKLKRTPGIEDILQYGKHSTLTYHKRFGGIKNARIKAGLAPSLSVTDEELLEEIKRLFQVLHKVPSNMEIKKYGKYSCTTYYSRFGGLRNAQVKAGFGNNPPSRPSISDEVLLGDLKRLQIKLKRIPNIRDLAEHGKYSVQTYYRRFGGIKNAQIKRV